MSKTPHLVFSAQNTFLCFCDHFRIWSPFLCQKIFFRFEILFFKLFEAKLLKGDTKLNYFMFKILIRLFQRYVFGIRDSAKFCVFHSQRFESHLRTSQKLINSAQSSKHYLTAKSTGKDQIRYFDTINLKFARKKIKKKKIDFSARKWFEIVYRWKFWPHHILSQNWLEKKNQSNLFDNLILWYKLETRKMNFVSKIRIEQGFILIKINLNFLAMPKKSAQKTYLDITFFIFIN